MAEIKERWLAGPVDGVPALLQPVAHAILQAMDEIKVIMTDFETEKLWQKPAGMASPGFHLKHMAGVLDRIFTYARGEALNPGQMAYLAAEAQQAAGDNGTDLVNYLEHQVEQALLQLKHTSVHSLTEARGVGRRQVPSTVAGLLFHAAEHMMRHTGQLMVTAAVLRQQA